MYSRHTGWFEEATSSDQNERQPGWKQSGIDEQPQLELAVWSVQARHAGPVESIDSLSQRRHRPQVLWQH